MRCFGTKARGAYVDHIVDGVQRPEMSQLAGALAVVSGLAPEARWARIIDTITDPERLVVRAWTAATMVSTRRKDAEAVPGHLRDRLGRERQIVLAEPFMSYVVHDAVALAGLADRLPDLYRRWSEFLVGGYDTIGECWGWRHACPRLELHAHPRHDLLHAGSHARRAGLYHSPHRAAPGPPGLGQGQASPRPTA